ncbi:MAG: ATP-binding protein [Hyphomicrobiales bacterium]
MLAICLLGGVTAERIAISGIRATAAERVLLYKSTLNNAINRLRHLPIVIAQHPAISDHLEASSDQAQLLAAAHAYLSSVNTASDAAVSYVLDLEGNTIAASNWQEEESFVGRNYSFRPYFQNALSGQEGRFFAIGVTTGRAGYFTSRPVFSHTDPQQIIGVVVVKVEMEQLQADWREAGELVFVTDTDGIVVFTSVPDWAYRTLKPLSAEKRKQIETNRAFIGQELDALSVEKISALGGSQDVVKVEGQNVQISQAQVDDTGFTVSYLAEVSAAKTARWSATVLLLAASILSVVLFLYLRERRRKQALDNEAIEARKIRKINQRLEAEINTRRQAENDLRSAQEELVLASKMAALGRMSAAIAHEVNQPIAAIRTFAASGKLLLERGMTSDATHTLEDIKNVTEHLATITSDLKLFARSSSEPHSLVSLQEALGHALKLFSTELIDKNVELISHTPQHDIMVSGSLTRIEQVLTNLIRNALDAMAHKRDAALLKVTLETEDGEAVLRVEDNGSGLSAEVSEQLFDPFFTTKPFGEGTGLGLAIAFGIIDEMGGKLRARNVEPNGAVFSIRLDVAKSAADDQEVLAGAAE